MPLARLTYKSLYKRLWLNITATGTASLGEWEEVSRVECMSATRSLVASNRFLWMYNPSQQLCVFDPLVGSISTIPGWIYNNHITIETLMPNGDSVVLICPHHIGDPATTKITIMSACGTKMYALSCRL